MIADLLLFTVALVLAVLYCLSVVGQAQSERELDRMRLEVLALEEELARVDALHTVVRHSLEATEPVDLYALPLLRAGGARPEVRNIEGSE